MLPGQRGACRAVAVAAPVVDEDGAGALDSFGLRRGDGTGAIGSWLPYLPVAIASALRSFSVALLTRAETSAIDATSKSHSLP